MWSGLLSSLDDATQADLAGAIQRRTYRKGEVVFNEGESGRRMAIVISGHLLAERVTIEGETVAVAVMAPDTVFGELALLGDERRQATVRAITAAEVAYLPGDTFAELRRNHAALDGLLMDLLSARLAETTQLLMEARHSPIEERLKRHLSELAEMFDNDIPITQATLASITGATRPTVNAALQELQTAGTIELRRGGLVVHNPAGLVD